VNPPDAPIFDKSPEQIERLNRLAAEHEDREVHVCEGDSNLVLHSVLPVESIGEREATFCLLDQRTFECEWQLCRTYLKCVQGLGR